MRQKAEQTRQNVLNKLYNQDIAPQDSQITSFYYHKTLALECLIATFSLCCLVLSLVSYIYKAELSHEIIKRIYNLLLIFTMLGVLGIILKKIAEMKWIKEKKQKNINIKREVVSLLLEVLFYMLCPMAHTDKTFQITTYEFDTKELNYNSFISFYMLFNRFVYIIIFLIHSELFYGSRPDRLSRLYTVKFGTFNAIKFLINEKPGSVIKVTFSFNFIILPFAMLLIEGQINKYLSSFHSCLYFVVVTQATVGYGDIVPISIFGRLVTLLIIMAGVTNTALLLILFMRLMELRGEEEESLFLLESLEKKVNLTKARVFRIENEWIYSNIRCPPQERSSKQQQLKAIRYNNRRNIMLDRAGPINVKRIMLSNFSQIVQNLNVIREKNNIIAKCIDVIKSSNLNEKPGDRSQMKDSKTGRNHDKKQSRGANKARENIRITKEKQNIFLKAEVTNNNKESFSELVNKDPKNDNQSSIDLIQTGKIGSKKPSDGQQKSNFAQKNQKISGFMYDNQNLR